MISRLLTLLVLLFALPSGAHAIDVACEPDHLPRPQRYTFTEHGVEFEVELRAICWRQSWSLSASVDALVKEAEVMLPVSLNDFDEVDHSERSRHGLGGGGRSSVGGLRRTLPGERRSYVATPLGEVGSGWLLDATLTFTIALQDGSAPESRVNIEARLDARRWPPTLWPPRRASAGAPDNNGERPRIRAPGLRTRVTVQSATWVDGQDLACPRGAVLVAASAATGATRCLELRKDVRVTGRVPAVPAETGGQSCPRDTLLVALTGETPCVALALEHVQVSTGTGFGSPHTVPSELLGWPAPSLRACPNQDLALAFDLANPALLFCVNPDLPLARMRTIHRDRR